MAETTETALPNFDAVQRYKFGESRAALSAVHDYVTESLKRSAREQQKLANALAENLGGATPDAKLFLCRELARVGTEDNAKEIAELLDDPATVEYARYALHPIPGDKVEKALIAKLKNADTGLKVLIINTLGARKNPSGVAALKKLADDKDAQVSSAAKAVLAKVNTNINQI